MSLFHNSRTRLSPLRRVSRKKAPTSESDTNASEEDVSSPPAQSPELSQPSTPSTPKGDSSSTQQLGGKGGVKVNQNFKPKQVPGGIGAFETGEANHEINSKKDYELCKEQVESGNANEEVLSHFKMVKDLKDVEAPPTMDKAIDNTESEH
ncbi:MAG: hypothetical protein CYPHOPRED_002418 [Cyphobasidiales sp. Tagirdzhanova-0007]|nr:MAG: hypothetical protein CYPHOPRED_002418 [Cyphobasidiales sp. Tagirdzhanova-0007]